MNELLLAMENNHNMQDLVSSTIGWAENSLTDVTL